MLFDGVSEKTLFSFAILKDRADKKYHIFDKTNWANSTFIFRYLIDFLLKELGELLLLIYLFWQLAAFLL